MDRSVGLGLRWGRASALAAVALLTAIVAHVGADGRLPGPLALLALGVAGTVGAAHLLGRPASTPRVVALLLATQAGAHLALTVLAGHRGDAAPGPRPAPAAWTPVVAPDGRRVGSLLDQTAPPAAGGATPRLPDAVGHLVADLSGPHLPMVLAHLAATLVLGWWLARGERLLWAVLALTARLLAVPATGRGPVASRRTPPVARPTAPVRTPVGVLRDVVVRRGPPVPVPA